METYKFYSVTEEDFYGIEHQFFSFDNSENHGDGRQRTCHGVAGVVHIPRGYKIAQCVGHDICIYKDGDNTAIAPMRDLFSNKIWEDPDHKNQRMIKVENRKFWESQGFKFVFNSKVKNGQNVLDCFPAGHI